MMAEHLKGWMADPRKEEAAAAKVKAGEGAGEVIGGPRG